jgi:hypothetical protein
MDINYPSQYKQRLRNEIATPVTDKKRKYVHQCIESNLILLELRIEELKKMEGTAISSMISECRTKIDVLIELYASIQNIRTSN